MDNPQSTGKHMSMVHYNCMRAHTHMHARTDRQTCKHIVIIIDIIVQLLRRARQRRGYHLLVTMYSLKYFILKWMRVRDVSHHVNKLFMCEVCRMLLFIVTTVTAVMRSRNFMDAAQAEKMREREAMENVKLLYHDNMIEMTPVSVVWTMSRVREQYLVQLYTLTSLSFVSINITTHYSHDIKICNHFVVGIHVTIINLPNHEMKHHVIFSQYSG